MLPTNPQALEEFVLKLPVTARATLAKKLLESLENLSDREVEQLWLMEAKRRKEEIAHGEPCLRDGEELLRRLEAEFQ